MDACSAVGRDIDKVLSKFTTYSDHASTTLGSLQNNIDSLKTEIEQVGYGDVTEAQAVILTQALGKVKEAVSRLSIEHRDLHSSVSRVGKAVDKNFTADFGCLANDEVLTGDKQHLVNEVICQHFYREGLLDIAEEHIKETGLELPGEAREPFFELNRILGALQNKDLGPALTWAQENRDKLRAQNSSLEFKLHRLAYISLLSQQPVNVSQAIEYARAHFTPFVYHHEKEESSVSEDKDVLMTEAEALEGILEQPESSKKRHRSSRSSQAPKKKSRTGQTSSPSPPYKDDLVLRVHLEELDDESVSPSSEDVAYIRKKAEEACLKELDFRPQIPPPIMCRGFIKFVCADKKTLGWLKNFVGSLKGPGFGHPGYLGLGPGDRPPMTKYLIRIPSGIEASDLLSLLVAHNEAIASKRFEIRKVFPGINGNTALVGCDADMVDLLEANKYQLTYGQGFITFKKKPTAVSNRDSEEARVIQSLMGCLLYVKGGLSNSPYAHLLSSSQWTEICEVFTRDACSLLGLSVDSSLAVCVNAGCTALPVLLNIKQVMAQRQVHNMWNTKEELPIEIDLGPTCRYHSIFACPILRQQSTESNPPMRLICGHVISRDALNKLTTGNKLKCPYCPVEQNPVDAQQIYF